MVYWLTTHFEIVAIVTLTVLAAVVILQQRRSPQSTAAWLLFFMLLPWLAVPVFLALGSRKQSSRYDRVDFSAPVATPAEPVQAMDATFQRFGLPAALTGQSLRLLSTPQTAYAALMETVNGAQISLDALFYIVGNDSTGIAFVDALTARARAGVRVRLILDRLGTGRGPVTALRRLRAAGGEILFHSPFLHRPGNGHLNLRNHRKMAISDSAVVFAGGMNIADHYLSPTPAADAWNDLAYLLEGSAIQTFCDVFQSDWEVAGGAASAPAKAVTGARVGHACVQLVPSGPDMTDDLLHDGTVRALHLAQRRIWIVTPYFIPTESLGNALMIAARRGVDVQIIVPARSNQRMTDFARGGYLRDLQTAGARVLFYQPGMIHAKAGVIDDLGFVGSANFDVRSMLLNFETALFAYDAETVGQLDAWFLGLVPQCRTRAPDAGMVRRLAEGVFRLGAPVL